MTANIRATLQLGKYPSIHDKTVVIQLDENFIYETVAPLDFPGPGTDSFTSEFICSGTLKIQRVMKRRETMAKYLANVLTRALLDSMGAKDTVMGYDK